MVPWCSDSQESALFTNSDNQVLMEKSFPYRGETLMVYFDANILIKCGEMEAFTEWFLILLREQ